MRYWIAPPYEKPDEFFKLYAESGREVIRGDYPKVFAYFFDRFDIDELKLHYWGFHLWDSIIVTAMWHSPTCGCDECRFIGPHLPKPMLGTIRA